jgi:crotonobetainyl-CoA:carnitine CoA-transferase CaiB-like acyl-CoA transferase
MDQVVTDPQTAAVDILRSTAHPRIEGYAEVGIPVSWNGMRPETRRVPPELGEDTREILRRIGRSPEEIDNLLAEEAVADNRATSRQDS